MAESVELASLIQKAAEIAASVPENLQETAFNRALDALLGELPQTATRRSLEAEVTPPPEVESRHPEPEHDLAKVLIARMDATAHADVKSAATVLERSLRVLHIARMDYDIDGLTPSEIATVLTDKFRISSPLSSVSDALGAAAGNLVDRVKEGRGYRYRIMTAGEEYLASASHATTPTPAKKPRPTKRAAKKKTEKKAPTKKAPARQRGDRLGPKKLLEQLIQERFFSEPRVIKDVIAYVADTMGRTYKATELSPALVRLLRDKRLSRTKNADGQYEYVAS